MVERNFAQADVCASYDMHGDGLCRWLFSFAALMLWRAVIQLPTPWMAESIYITAQSCVLLGLETSGCIHVDAERRIRTCTHVRCVLIDAAAACCVGRSSCACWRRCRPATSSSSGLDSAKLVYGAGCAMGPPPLE
eukprot:6179534-Pleurochrysis_carterae.AAC.9